MISHIPSFNELKKAAKNPVSGKEIKAAFLGDSATQLIFSGLKGASVLHHLNIQWWEADFNQIERQILDPTSELYEFQPQWVIVFMSSHKLLSKFNGMDVAHRMHLWEKTMGQLQDYQALIQERCGAQFIVYNFTEIDDSVFGNYANKTQQSFLYQIRRLNVELMQWASSHKSVHIVDIATVHNTLGRNQFFSSNVYINSEMIVSLDAIPAVAVRTVQTIASLNGQVTKCVILDLDNTTWGGIIGDDGLENIQVGTLGIGKAFSEFQQWVKKLKQRGIIVAVCSKNTESVAQEPFISHPEMVLRLDDIAVFVANWDNKADNIRYIQHILNIGFDSMVFLDDNPFERNLVRENIPGILVPEIPEDPGEYLNFLYTLNLFETPSISEEDAERTALYQQEAKRVQNQMKFTNEDEFLASLEMISVVEGFSSFNTPRVSQLTQRSNQFNLRTIRLSESDVQDIEANQHCLPLTFTLSDKFGDHGLIAIVWMKEEDQQTLFIENWLMSCRVLKRGMESFTLNTLVEKAKAKGYSRLKGQYLPTAKNEMVKDHYSKLGFENQGDYWILALENYEPKNVYINPLYK